MRDGEHDGLRARGLPRPTGTGQIARRHGDRQLKMMSSSSVQGDPMLGVIAGVLLVLWLLGFLIFHVTAGAIHLLLVSAVVLFVLHLLKGRGVI
jgi:hypothetical protein